MSFVLSHRHALTPQSQRYAHSNAKETELQMRHVVSHQPVTLDASDGPSCPMCEPHIPQWTWQRTPTRDDVIRNIQRRASLWRKSPPWWAERRIQSKIYFRIPVHGVSRCPRLQGSSRGCRAGHRDNCRIWVPRWRVLKGRGSWTFDFERWEKQRDC